MKNLRNSIKVRVWTLIWKLGDDSLEYAISIGYYNDVNILITSYIYQRIRINIYNLIKINL